MAQRALFVLLSALAGMALFLRGEGPSSPYLFVGFALGAGAAGLILIAENALQKLSFGIIVGGTAGLAVGLILTGLVEWVGSIIFDIQTVLFHIRGLVLLLGLLFLRPVLGARFGHEKISGSAKHPAQRGIVTI